MDLLPIVVVVIASASLMVLAAGVALAVYRTRRDSGRPVGPGKRLTRD